jgi:1,4-dihydroxy-2-naphthoyl-CoA synthase
MEVSGYVTRVWKYDGLTQMNATNAFSFYIIRLAMPNQETVYQVADRIATITLNRPDKPNAWTAIMEREVRFAVEGAERDENCASLS